MCEREKNALPQQRAKMFYHFCLGLVSMGDQAAALLKNKQFVRRARAEWLFWCGSVCFICGIRPVVVFYYCRDLAAWYYIIWTHAAHARPLPQQIYTKKQRVAGKLRFLDAGGRDGYGISCSEKSVGCCAERIFVINLHVCDPLIQGEFLPCVDNPLTVRSPMVKSKERFLCYV